MWLHHLYSFGFPKKKVLMAEVLKYYYPKYVDVHNYVAGNSIAKKVDNWCTLNRKVFSKIDMKLRKELINQLAGSQSGVIEKVLADLRARIQKDCDADEQSLYSNHEDDKDGKVTDEIVNRISQFIPTVSIFSTIQTLTQLTSHNPIISCASAETVRSVLNPDVVTNKNVPRHVYTRLKHELQEKDDKISTLQQKISHMESIMKLKDQRIDDLTLQIAAQSQDLDISPRSQGVSKLCGTKL
ncbi:PREDICTED: sperm flagellar protein 1 isoform X2 [Dinoponera quadriceps]|uniref:Sperm flagellar protein 1 isoform X2 n=1 Tax=Dinoponera quadriceps TaxID=609295 RepID=A0A6P3XY56_DINQU|nr:PREDICTED: sperm flagellar protein 1 isoform X2 [Dinoponera quadriceps]